MSRLLRRRLTTITSPYYRLLKQYITSKLTSNGIACTRCWPRTFCLVGELNDSTPSKRWESVDCVTTRAIVRSLQETVSSQRHIDAMRTITVYDSQALRHDRKNRRNRARILSYPKIKQEWDIHTCQDDHLGSIPRWTRTTTLYITEDSDTSTLSRRQANKRSQNSNNQTFIALGGFPTETGTHV